MAAAAHGGDYLRRFVAETEWYNAVVLSAVAPGDWWRGLPHPVQSWMRNCVGGYLLYFISGFLWCFVIYYWKRHAYIPKDAIPTNEAMKKQIVVASKAMPFYCALPTLSEYMIESGWTQCYFNISEVGFSMYLCYMAMYLIFVEFGIYWMHRELHDIKPLYKYLHATHHIYNKENTLSPFAGNSVLSYSALNFYLAFCPYHRYKIFIYDLVVVCIMYFLDIKFWRIAFEVY